MNLSETHPLHLGLLFGKFTKQYIGFITKQLKSVPIERYFYALLLICKSEQKLTQKDLSEILERDKTSSVRLLDYLQDNDMISRVKNPDDRREHFIVLTEKSKQYIPQIDKAFESVNDVVLKGLSDSEKLFFYKIIEKMIHNLSQEPMDEIVLEFDKIKHN
jgi:DNA-binding MarR family transcriptional regulator